MLIYYISSLNFNEQIKVRPYSISGKTVYQKVVEQPMQQLKFGWTEISGDFYAPNGK